MIVRQRTVSAGWLQAGPEVRRVLREGWGSLGKAPSWEPPTDVYENDAGLVIQVEIAGMREGDFSITMDERLLVIEGVRTDPEPKRAYHQMEIGYGEFRTEVYLPWSADPEHVEATYETGFLRVVIPRPPACHVPVAPREA